MVVSFSVPLTCPFFTSKHSIESDATDLHLYIFVLKHVRSNSTLSFCFPIVGASEVQ